MFVAVVAMMVVQAALTARAMTARRRGLILLFPIGVAALSLVILWSVGTRYFLGFFCSVVLFYVARLSYPLSNRRLAGFALAVLALVAAQGTMRFIRGTMVSGLEEGSISSALVRPETYGSSEGMLRVLAWVHEKEVFASGDRLPEHLFLLYWWVPRAVWPSKPTMDGYWLAREVMADGDVGTGHSVAGGFLLPALLDLGPNLGIVMCLFYGLGLFAADRFWARHRDPADPGSVFAALLPFGVFFAMRSPQTSALFLESCIVVYLPIYLLVRSRLRRRPGRRRRVAPPRPGCTSASPVPVGVRMPWTRGHAEAVGWHT